MLGVFFNYSTYQWAVLLDLELLFLLLISFSEWCHKSECRRTVILYSNVHLQILEQFISFNWKFIFFLKCYLPGFDMVTEYVLCWTIFVSFFELPCDFVKDMDAPHDQSNIEQESTVEYLSNFLKYIRKGPLATRITPNHLVRLPLYHVEVCFLCLARNIKLSYQILSNWSTIKSR